MKIFLFHIEKMPYHIRKMPNQDKYKVYTDKGKPLSKKGLTYKQAEKQKIAVSLSEGIYKRK